VGVLLVRGTLLLGHDEEALRRGPARSVLLLVHAHDLHLAGDGSAVGASGHAQVHAGVDVAQSNVGTPHPAVVGADHLPVVAGVAEAVGSVGGNLLLARER